jgi:hypothetical protein
MNPVPMFTMKGKGTNKECPHLDDHLLKWKSKMKRGRK